jgi:hypothetical protein
MIGIEFEESPDLVAARAALSAADTAYGVEIADGVRLDGQDHLATAYATGMVAAAAALERIAAALEARRARDAFLPADAGRGVR